MKSNARCWTPQPAAPLIAMLWLTGCAMGASDAPPSACPPVVDYSRPQQARVADEIARLPEGALIIGWLADYAVLRDQARVCE
jgi:hypothetical protein